MFNELVQLCDRERLIGDPAFEIRPVSWIIHVSKNGESARFIGTQFMPAVPETEAGKKPKKAREQVKKLLIPRQFNPLTGGARTSGDFAYLLVDKSDYVLGFDPKAQPREPQTDEKLRRRQQLFIDKVAACYEATGEKALEAVLTYLRSIAKNGLTESLPEKCSANDLFAFRVEPELEGLVHEIPSVEAYWRSQCKRSIPESSRWRCLVDGSPVENPGLFPKVKRVPGGQSAGTVLVSFNAPAFESYGWKSSENAPISDDAAQKATTALNRLLDPAFEVADGRPTLPSRHERIGKDTVLCYWPAASPTDTAYQFANVWGALRNVTTAPDTGKVASLIQALWLGVAPDTFDDKKFYAVTLTGAQGRAIVRDWFETTVGQLQASIATYFRQLSLCRNTHGTEDHPNPPAQSYLALVGNLYKNPNQAFPKLDDIPSRVAVAYNRAFLSESIPFPDHLLAKVIERIKARIGDSTWSAAQQRDSHAALIKAILIRNHNQTNLKPTLDMETPMPSAYRLGQLFACIERMQSLALGKEVNATVANRYFSAAATTPGLVFPRLITLYNQHYFAKAKRMAGKDDGRPFVANTEFHEIMRGITAEDGIPSKQSLKDQGLFMLGFHHQRHRFWFGAEGADNAPTTKPDQATATVE